MSLVSLHGANNWHQAQGDGPPLLIIGGFALGHHQVDAVAPMLQAHFRVILWDHRGMGLSDRSLPEGYSPAAWADDLKELLDHLGTPRVHLWGTSTGSMIAVQFAARYPDRTGGLVTHPSFTGETTRRQMLLTYSAVVEFFGIRAMVRILVDTLGLPADVLHSDKGRETEDWITQTIEANISPEDYVRMCHIFANADLTQELPKVEAPTLVLGGTSGPLGDGAFKAQIENFQKAIPGCKVKMIEGGGTAFMVQRPGETAEVVTDFVRNLNEGL